MAKQRNERLKRGRITDLDEETRKRAVKLNDDYYIIYPMELAQNMFSIKKELQDESKSVQKAERDAARNDLKKDEVENDFVIKNTTSSKFSLKGMSVLSKDWRFMASDSPEMLWVRASLAALNNLLEEGLAQYINEQGIFDGKSYSEKINKAYNEFFEAAQNYLDSRDPSSPPGKRRKNQVAALLNNAKKQRLDINSMVDAIKDGAIDFSTMDAEKKNSLNSLNIVNELTSREADGEVEWQNEGNSTDVYKLQLKDEKGQTYFLKENLPFLNENMEGFLNRRFRQLQTSQANKANPGPGRPVEDRIKDIEAEDYEFGRRLLSTLLNGIKNASEDSKGKISEQFAGYFAYNFDDVFKEMEFYNKAADFKPQNADMTIDQMIEKARHDGNDMLAEALRFRKQVMKAEGTYKPDAKVGEVIKKVNAKEWLTKKMNLDPKKDSVFLKCLDGMTDKQVETMFRVTMGKEVELFGQMSANKVQNGDDKAAINNTATSRVAEHLGFDDVITKSKTTLVKFTRRDGTTVNQLCTISEEAPGRELIDIMKEAERTGKKIIYSPEAMRNLMRLQAIDTLCLQKDRHGRNFKCLTDIDKKTGNIIIKSVKAYDNDMSFDAVSLAEAFTDPETGEIRRNQFLPAMTTKVEKDSALYKHILGTYCGVDVVTPYKLPPTPEIRFGARHTMAVKGRQIEYAFRNIWGNKHISQLDSISSMMYDYDSNYFEQNFLKEPLKPEDQNKLIQDVKDLGLDKEVDKRLEDNTPLNQRIAYYGAAKMIYLINKMKSIWVRTPDEQKAYEEQYKAEHEGKKPGSMDTLLKQNLTDQQKIELKGYIDELDSLSKQFNFSGLLRLQPDDKAFSYADIFAKSASFLFNTTYGDNPEMRMLTQAKNYNALKSLMDDDGNIVIPSLLHYDKEAKDQLEQKVADYENPNSQAYMKLREVGLSKEKIAALATRNREMLNNLKQAEQKALKFYEAVGWTTPPQNSFYLEKADYKELKGLGELAVDPGNTYLAVDNENYLVGQTFMMNVEGKMKPVKYEQLMNEREQLKAMHYNEYILEDKKRWKYTDQEKNNQIKKYNVNNTIDTSASVANSVEYVRACMNDKIYEISHGVIHGAEEIKEKLKDAIFLAGLQKSIESADIGGLKQDGLKALMEPDSAGRRRFDESFNTEEGRLYQEQLDKAVNKMSADMNYKKLNEKKFEAMNDMCVEGALNKIFDKMAQPNADINALIDQAKKMGDFGKNLGSTVKAEKAFDKYIQKNPNAISEQQKTAVKNGLKPAQKVVQPEANKQNNAQRGGMINA